MSLRVCFVALAFVACGDSAPADDSADGGTSSTGSTGSTMTTGGGSVDGGSGGTAGGDTCLACGEVENLSSPASTGLVEASGLAASSVHEGAFYAHNDSGDTARFFAFGADGSDLGTYDVAGATAIDWEDMSRGPCADPKKSCLYFGDIGDNDTQRKTYVVYRVEEPATLGPGTFTAQAEAFTFRYPDGSHNAEALFVHPTTGVIYIVTKSASAAKIFAFPTPLDTKKTATLVDLGEATVPDLIPLVTGGDIHPSGTGILLRTYTSIWLYPIARGGTVEAALAAKPCSLPTPVERQGETIAWTASGDGYRSISEGSRQTVHGVTCGHN